MYQEAQTDEMFENSFFSKTAPASCPDESLLLALSGLSGLQAAEEKKRVEFTQGPRTTLAARLYRISQKIFALPALLVYCCSNDRAIIREDASRWIKLLHLESGSTLSNLLTLLGGYEEFRNLYYYRAWQGGVFGAVATLLTRAVYKPCSSVYLRTPEIGPGLFIQHGYATSVGAYRIGRNCTINQLVVIGWTDRTRGPILGDNVSIKAGAKVLGPITIGDNVTVGANAVVIRNVPPDCVVAGVPARIIRRNGVRVDEPL